VHTGRLSAKATHPSQTARWEPGQICDGERGLLANARCLAEGVDVPTLDGVAFVDPRRSEVDIIQAVGRAIRLDPVKTVGTIVIPVFIDTETNPEKALDSSVFKPVWDVIKALRAHDDELGRQLDGLRREIGKLGGVPELPDKVHFDVPAKVGIDFAHAFDVRLVEETTASWEFWFGLLEQFVERHGHTRVGRFYAHRGYRLGGWVHMQRHLHANGTFDADRERRLKGVPGWTWDPLADQWEEGFRRLLRYVESKGDARVPRFYLDDGFKLGGWVHSQRRGNAEGTLDTGRQRRLQDLPGWTWSQTLTPWEEWFGLLEAFVESNGHARVPVPYTVDGYRLGGWVNTQRDFYRRGTLDADHQHRLQELPGWTWDPHADQWEEGFRRLQQYVELNSHTRIPRSYTVDGYKLGHWVNNQRTFHSKGRLEADRERRLLDLTGWRWDTKADQWEEGFSRLLYYVELNSHTRIPRSYTVDGYRLGQWVQTQRANHAKGILDADRQDRLQNLTGWAWDAIADQWEEGFSRLLRYVEQNGDARVPKSYTVDGYRLGSWVNKQRQRHAEGTLDADRERRLEDEPGWTWDPHADQWEEGFRRLQQYVERHGDARVPARCTVDGYRLGAWVTTQRHNHVKGTLDPDRQHRLQELPGWTWKARQSS
jgi:Helicase associated domain